MVARETASSDEDFSLSDGDLGLGFGLKPGGIPREDFEFGGFYFGSPRKSPCKPSPECTTSDTSACPVSDWAGCKIDVTSCECSKGDLLRCKHCLTKRLTRGRTLQRSNSDSSADIRTCPRKSSGSRSKGNGSRKGLFMSGINENISLENEVILMW